MLINFTGHASINACYMENGVWCNSLVYKLLKDRFIIASLIVDSRVPLMISNTEDSAVGQFSFNYEQEKYDADSQPLYDIVDSQNNSLVSKLASYQLYGAPAEFKWWLDEGFESFRKQNNQQSQIKNNANDILDLKQYQVHTQADYGKKLRLSQKKLKDHLRFYNTSVTLLEQKTNRRERGERNY